LTQVNGDLGLPAILISNGRARYAASVLRRPKSAKEPAAAAGDKLMHPTSHEYERYDAVGLADLVRRRDVQAAELVSCAIDRIERRNPFLNAVVHKMYEAAFQAAESPLPASPLAGVPFLLKDLFAALAGEPLTYSSRLLADYAPTQDSELVLRYRRGGLIIVGKTNTSEFGLMPVTESEFRGPARNPWDTDITPGGSSGGTAAAVASGIVPVAHGSDGGGSLRMPASCRGLFGMKPSCGFPKWCLLTTI
jgi:amidase